MKTLLGVNTGNPDHLLVINTLRLPRTLVAFMVGVALAISGTIFQGLTRNPLTVLLVSMLGQASLQLQ